MINKNHSVIFRCKALIMWSCICTVLIGPTKATANTTGACFWKVESPYFTRWIKINWLSTDQCESRDRCRNGGHCYVWANSEEHAADLGADARMPICDQGEFLVDGYCHENNSAEYIKKDEGYKVDCP